MICMVKFKVRLYGLIPDEFMIKELTLPEPFNLERLEKEIIKRFGDRIHTDYISDQGLLNHQLVRVGDPSGKRLDYGYDISEIEEIWFIVPITGG
ncbi:MAG TPA: hypothetical protein GXX59_09365 [Syntrophomonadaceae bacterium]|nr:hypothetical protein [Syntrophomonadaceae bacterium]